MSSPNWQVTPPDTANRRVISPWNMEVIISVAKGRMTPTLYGILMQKANYRAPGLILNDERRLISPSLADDSTRYTQ